MLIKTLSLQTRLYRAYISHIYSIYSYGIDHMRFNIGDASEFIESIMVNTLAEEQDSQIIQDYYELNNLNFIGKSRLYILEQNTTQ